MVTEFQDTIVKGGYESIHGGSTLGVMGVLIKKKGVFGRYLT